MTNRQSNIIFYSVISIVVYALVINYFYPHFFDNFTKNDAELSIQKAMKQGEYNIALGHYQQILEERINSNNINNAETAEIYEDMAKLHALLKNKPEEKNHYLKSIRIKEQLKKTSGLGLASNYDRLGSLAEAEENYDHAQQYYEKSLSLKLGEPEKEEDEGLFVGMQYSRQKYLRLNNEMTIDTLKKLGSIHNIKQENSIAKSYYEKALAASKETFGESEPQTLEIIDIINQLAR